MIEQNDDTDWWLEETWKIKSLNQAYGLELYILFLVDPQYDGSNKSQAVWAVSAVDQMPNIRPIEHEEIILIDLQKGKLDQKLEKFILGINEFRNQKN